MGKPTGDDQVRDDPEGGIDGGGVLFCRCSKGLRGIRGAVTLRCVLFLLLGVGVLLSAVFWLPPFWKLRSDSDDGGADKYSAPIQASFILQKPISLVAVYTRQLEYDIFEEIGVPNTKVSIITMHPLTASNSTYVVFGILSNSKNAVISPVVLSVLRSSLIELVLQQSNLSLTSSSFGQPSSFGILKFPGGITVIPVQSASIWQTTQILFNFTLINSIDQIENNLDELKDQLKFGLNLRSYENVYVQMTNSNGSTVAPPVTVEASVLSDVGSRNLLPSRLKQLAQTITRTPAKNLGLDHSVFGKVKEVRLSSFLNNSITSMEAPSPSPSPSNELPYSGLAPGSTYPATSPYAPAPSPDSGLAASCLNCEASPFGSPPSHSAAPQDRPEPPSPQYSTSPSPSVPATARAPRHSPCISPKSSPYATPVAHSHPPVSDQSPHEIAPSQQKRPRPAAKMAPSPRKALGPTPEMAWNLSPSSPSTVHSMSPQYNKGSSKSGKSANSLTLASSPTSPSPSSSSVVGGRYHPLCPMNFGYPQHCNVVAPLAPKFHKMIVGIGEGWRTVADDGWQQGEPAATTGHCSCCQWTAEVAEQDGGTMVVWTRDPNPSRAGYFIFENTKMKGQNREAANFWTFGMQKQHA